MTAGSSGDAGHRVVDQVDPRIYGVFMEPIGGARLNQAIGSLKASGDIDRLLQANIAALGARS